MGWLGNIERRWVAVHCCKHSYMLGWSEHFQHDHIVRERPQDSQHHRCWTREWTMPLGFASIGVGTSFSDWCTMCLQLRVSMLATMLHRSGVLTLCRLVDGAGVNGLGGGKGHEAGDEKGNEGVLMHLIWLMFTVPYVCTYMWNHNLPLCQLSKSAV